MAFEEVSGVVKKETESVQLIQKDGIGFRVVCSFGFGGYKVKRISCEINSHCGTIDIDADERIWRVI